MNTRFIRHLALIVLVLCGAAAQAQIVDGQLIIREYADPLQQVGGWAPGYYVVANGSNSDIQTFAVTNPKPGNIWAHRDGWSGISLGKSAWNGYFGDIWKARFGSYESLFGPTSDAYVNIYWATTNNYIHPGEESEHFDFGGAIASEYVAWNPAGKLVGRTFITAVPEPETYAMLLAGLGFLLLISRCDKARKYEL